MNTTVTKSAKTPNNKNNLDGSNRRTLQVALGNLTGIAYVELPVGPVGESAS